MSGMIGSKLLGCGYGIKTDAGDAYISSGSLNVERGGCKWQASKYNQIYGLMCHTVRPKSYGVYIWVRTS